MEDNLQTVAPADAHYDARYYQTVMKEFADEEFYRVRARTMQQNYFGSFAKPYGDILEYGCGLGQNIWGLAGATGFDVSPAALAECRRRGIATIDDWQSIPREHFDYVLCRHVLEHTEEPLTILRRLLGFLKPTGTLILIVPKEPHRRVPIAPDIHQHLYAWNFQTIDNLILRAGGAPTDNRYEPMFGYRSYQLLKPVLKLCGHGVYYRAGRLVGRLLRQTELVVHVRRTA